MLKQMFVTAAAGLALVGCVADGPVQPVQAKRQGLVSVICTPGEQRCDFSCENRGGPSSDDCIVQCNEEGTGWTTIADWKISPDKRIARDKIPLGAPLLPVAGGDTAKSGAP